MIYVGSFFVGFGGILAGYFLSCIIDRFADLDNSPSWKDLYYTKKEQWEEVNDRILRENGRVCSVAKRMHYEAWKADPNGLCVEWAYCWPWLKNGTVSHIENIDEEDDDDE